MLCYGHIAATHLLFSFSKLCDMFAWLLWENNVNVKRNVMIKKPKKAADCSHPIQITSVGLKEKRKRWNRNEEMISDIKSRYVITQTSPLASNLISDSWVTADAPDEVTSRTFIMSRCSSLPLSLVHACSCTVNWIDG